MNTKDEWLAEIDRKVWVYDPWPDDEQEKERNWHFNYAPGADAETLSGLTKRCHIQKCPDMEYKYYVEVNGKRYYFFATGEGAIIQVCILCILLDNKRLETFLRSMEISQGKNSEYAKQSIEKRLLPKTGPFYYFK